MRRIGRPVQTVAMPTDLRDRPTTRVSVTLLDWFDAARRGCFAGRIDMQTAAAGEVLLWDDDAVIERCRSAQAAPDEAAA